MMIELEAARATPPSKALLPRYKKTLGTTLCA